MNPEKSDIFLALLRDQHFVCVYCGKAISREWGIAHIEHFLPSAHFPQHRFDWLNLFASCGPRTGAQQPSTCGDAKEDWIPQNHIEPTDPDCERMFEYDGQGQINASHMGGSRADTMIGALNLNEQALVYERYQIIAELERQIATGSITNVNVIIEISSWRLPDINGCLKSYGHVAARYLEVEAI